MLKVIKVIVFDYGGVLGSDSDAWESNFSEISTKTGLGPDVLESILNRYWPDMKVGKSSVRKFWKEVYGKSKKRVAHGVLEDLYEKGISADSDMLDYAKKLKEKGYRVAIFSNETREWINIKIKKFDLNNIFEKVYCSAFMGIAKPGKQAFEYVINDLGVKPKETVFIDDRERNILVAKKFGMSTILFKNLRQLRTELIPLLR